MKTFSKKNIPNIISLFRIILVPIIFILVILSFIDNNKINLFFTIKINEQYTYSISIYFILSALLFLIAILSDFLDGFIARKYNLVTDSGKLLDAIADKILVNAILIAFLYESILPVFIVFLLIIRDFIMDAFRLFLSTKKNIVLAASKLGKYKTFFIMIGLFILFIINRQLITDSANNTLSMYNWINQILLIPIYIGAILSIYSFISYFCNTIKKIKINSDTKKEENE